MAYPAGRLIAVCGGKAHVLAVDGWLRLGTAFPRNAVPVTKQEAEDWCEAEGWDLFLLDQLPTD